MKKKILLVDDDMYLRNSISIYLEDYGFAINTVDSVISALSHIRKQIPDLIIADIMMPNVDGYDFIKILRSDNFFSSIPVIFLTAKGMTNDRIMGYDAGCNAYLTKPFDPNELLSIINNILNNKFLGNVKLASSFNTLLPDKQAVLGNFTNREITILQLVIRGFRNKEIAKLLDMSIRNVEKYVSRLLNKTSTRNRTELTQFINNIGIELLKGE